MAQNIRTLQPGEYLCLQGEDSTEIYVLRAGKLNIYVVDAVGLVPQDRVEKEGMLVGEVSEQGAFIGEIGAILNEPRTASMRASDDGPVQVMVISLQGKGFAQTVVGNPKIGFGLSKTIAQRIGRSCDSITKADALAMKAKVSMEHYAKNIYELVDGMESAYIKKAEAEAKAEIEERKANAKKGEKVDTKMPEIVLPQLLADAKATLPYQLGRFVDKYSSVPADIYAAVGSHYKALDDLYRNRTMSGQEEVQGQEAPVPAGPPKPGVAAFEPGSVVCPEKSVDQNLFILLGGKLELFVGRRSLEFIKMKGDIFGENAMFGGLERSTGIRALTPVHAMAVPKNKIEAFLMGKPAIMVHVLRSFARRLPILNDTLLTTAHQMTHVMNLFGRGLDGCVPALESLVPKFQEGAAGIGSPDGAGKAASLLQELKGEFDQVNAEYDQLCQEIGYKPVDSEEPSGLGKIPPTKFEFATKLEQLDMLDVEHANFVLNSKKDQFRACAIEIDHDALMKNAKVPDSMKPDFIYGRICNIGESFPSQFICVDMDRGAAKTQGREYVLRCIKFMVENSEQEAVLLFQGGRCVEAMYIPDHIKMEDDLVDEETINEIMDAFKKKPDDRENLEKLNGLFWDIVIGTVQKRLPKVKDNIIPFEDEDLKLMNFGLLDEKFLPDNSEVPQQIAEDRGFVPPEAQDLEYIYLSDSLQTMYKEVSKYNEHQGLLADQAKIEAVLKACQDRIKTILGGRLELVKSFPGGASGVQIVQKYDGIVKGMAVLDRKMKAGGSLSPEERAKIVQARNVRTQLQNHLNNFLSTLKGKVSDDQVKQFTDLGAELEKKVLEELVIIERVAKAREIVKNHEIEMRQVSIKQRETAYKNEIISLKKYILMAAKRAKVDPIAVLVNVREIATKKRVAEIIDIFLQENVDPEIFDDHQPRIKVQGKPKIMLMPGTGNAMYDYERHVFLVPLTPPKTLEESISNAFMEFHWDMDEDKSMRESYGQLKIYKKLSYTKLKQQLAKDYLVWATQESKGWKKLDKEVRAWFLVKIARQKIEGD